jgi:hypothetical protein
MMLIDPKLLQWAAGLLLILSGVQNLVGINVQRGLRAGLRVFGAVVSLAAITVGVLIMINLIGVRV